MKKRHLLVLFAVLLLFLLAVSRLETGREARDLQQLEDAVRRTAVTCYALEGFYPPDLDYMRRHYALHYDSQRYLVHYEVFADNLMPDITVLEK